MWDFFQRLFDRRVGILAARDPQWRYVRKDYILRNPRCIVCGGTNDLVAHHVKPFHLFPNLELDHENLVTLCESKKYGVNCHLWFGHLGNFKLYNPDVISDAVMWRAKTGRG
ncbi:MAG: HNH endonuclease [Hyphomicrobiaceae bacterium]|nr:MAG: HNH endonuclease [Hyphomicrobiaceae bacterium]